MTDRQIKILEFVFNSTSGAYAKEISTLLSITTRTLRNDINEINDSFQKGPIIVSENTCGYYVPDAYREYVRSFLFEEKTKREIMDNSRFISILGYLLVGKQNKYDLAEALFISEQTLYRNITNIKNILNHDYHLTIILEDDAYRLDCSEAELRRLIYRLVIKYQPKEKGLVESFLELLLPTTFDQQEYQQAHYKTKEVFDTMSNPTSKNNQMILSSVIYITLIREEEFKLSTPDDKTGSDLEAKVATLIEDNFEINKEAAILLSKFISTINIFETEVDDFTKVILSEFSDDILKKYNYDIKQSQELYHNLLLHCEFMLRRIDEGYELVNPLKNHIKNTYSFSFEMSMLVVPIIYKYKKVFLTQDEVSYIALYLEHFVKNLNPKIYVLILTNARKAIFNNTYHWLTSNFSEHLEIIEYDDKTDFMTFVDIHNIDLIISFEESSLHPVIPTYRIYNMPNARDLEHINVLIYQIKIRHRFRNIIETCFDEGAITVFEEKLEFEEVILNLSKKMEALDWIDDAQKYCDNVIDREAIYPTTMGNSIMMPHPIFCFAKRTCVAVGLLKEPIIINNETVQLILLLGTEEKENDDITILFSLVDQIVKDMNLENKIKDMNSSQTIIEYLKSI